MGVAHGDDLQYIFQDVWGEDLLMSPSDTKFTRNIFTPLLANFAKTSIPTPVMTEAINVAWPPQSPNSNRVLKINNKLEVEENYKSDRLRFWWDTIANLLVKKEKKNKNKSKEKDEL
jgi:carboxylesterase type B